MKKTHLFAASALFTVMLLGSVAQAATPVTDPAAAHHAVTKAAKPAVGPAHEVMMEVREENKELFAEMKMKREELQSIIKAETFDKAAFMAKHEELDALHAKMSKARAEAMAEKLSTMKAEDRAKMPMMMGMGPKEHGPKGKGHGMMNCMGTDCPMQGEGGAAAPSKK